MSQTADAPRWPQNGAPVRAEIGQSTGAGIIDLSWPEMANMFPYKVTKSWLPGSSLDSLELLLAAFVAPVGSMFLFLLLLAPVESLFLFCLIFFHLWPWALWPHWPLDDYYPYSGSVLPCFAPDWFSFSFAFNWNFCSFGSFSMPFVWLLGLCCLVCLVCLLWSLWPSGSTALMATRALLPYI